MLIDLLNAPLLGHWNIDGSTSQCEFQFGERLIYVEHLKETSHVPALQAAQLIIQQVWDDSQHAIAFAEPWFRTKHPAFWNAWDKATTHQHPLRVYSISFPAGDSAPYYWIARDPGYSFECVMHDEHDLWQQEGLKSKLPYFPDSDAVVVSRLGEQQFALSELPSPYFDAT